MIRLLGLTRERIVDFRQNPRAKNAGFYAALDRRFSVVDVLRPLLSPFEKWTNRALHVHPNIAFWRLRNQLNYYIFQRRTLHAERLIAKCSGQYDLIVQLHTLFAPGRDLQRCNYVLHTDNTYMLSERFYKGWVTMGRKRERDAWVCSEGEVYRNAAFLFPRTEFLRRSLIEDYGCNPERIAVVGYGANFVADSLEQRRYDQRTAIFVGLDFYRKGGPALLKAWKLVRRSLPKAQLLIIGPRRPLYSLPPGVTWVGRVTDRDELGRLYSQSTVFVMPSLFEPSGSVFLEAMGHGLSCISTDHGANPEIIDHNRNGLLVTLGDVEALAVALVQILGDPRLAATLGRQAHQQVLHRFTWDVVVDRMAPYIEQVASERGLRLDQRLIG